MVKESKNIDLTCPNCGSKEFYISFSERSNTILEIKDGILKKDNTMYDIGEIESLSCKNCNAEIRDFDEYEINLRIQNYLD
jgi:predicted nucleic-acid-binding Zn-ribbon protein